MTESLNGKLRSNVREVDSISLGKIGHFSITIQHGKGKPESVENIYLTDKLYGYAKNNLKKGVIATVFYEEKLHSWHDIHNGEVRTETKKFATFIKPHIREKVNRNP